MPRPTPNLVYLHSHDTGRVVQPYGHAIATPHLQALAESGYVFRQAFSAAPTCSPSRAALLTGQAAHSSGMLGLAHRGFALTDVRQHLVHTLRAAGYVSALVGMQHVAADPATIGYDEIVERRAAAAYVAPAAVAWLSRAPAGPFFLDVGFEETHRPFHPLSPDEDPRYCQPPVTLPDTPRTRADMAAFHASVRALDTGIGAVLSALQRNGLTDDTLVICTTDHGPPFPGMKGTVTDHGTGVMLILRVPGGFAGGQVSDALVSQVDLFPTICDLLAIPRPPWLQGHSLLPLVRREVAAVRAAVFAEVSYHAAYEPQRAIRTDRWRYIRRFGDRLRPVLPNVDDSPSKDIWVEHGWRERPLAPEELYDLVFDPQECRNVAGDPALAPVLDDLRRRLADWMRDTDDPLLRGPILQPPGAAVNDAAGLSPDEPTTRI